MFFIWLCININIPCCLFLDFIVFECLEKCSLIKIILHYIYWADTFVKSNFEEDTTQKVQESYKSNYFFKKAYCSHCHIKVTRDSNNIDGPYILTKPLIL